MSSNANGLIWSPNHLHIPFSLPVVLSTVEAGDLGPSGGPNPRRDEWLRELGYTPSRTALRKQVHSRRIVHPDPVTDYRDEADGTASDDPTLALAVTVADCMPIAVHDPVTGAFAMLHSGWRGTGILAHALELFQERWGSVGKDVHVLLGPCIGPCCYPVDEARAAEYSAEWGKAGVVRGGDGRVRLDLRAANREILKRYGVVHTTDVALCTGCTQALGSYRRQGPDRFVRMVAVIAGSAHGQ